VKGFDRHRLRPGAEPGNRDHLVTFGKVDHDRRDPGETDILRLQHGQRHAAGASGIDRIAAGLENLECGLRRQVMPGGRHVAGAHQVGAVW
jgi:hypothetical protein